MHQTRRAERESLINFSWMKWELGADFWRMLSDLEILHQKSEQRREKSFENKKRLRKISPYETKWGKYREENCLIEKEKKYQQRYSNDYSSWKKSKLNDKPVVGRRDFKADEGGEVNRDIVRFQRKIKQVYTREN